MLNNISYINMFNQDSKTWAQMLAEYRQAAGHSKSALARLSGVTISYISKLENGKKPPPEHQRWQLAEALGLNDEQTHWFHIQAELERSDPIAVKYLMQLVDHMVETRDPSAPLAKPKTRTIEDAALFSGELHTIAIINKAAAGYPEEFTDLDYPVGVAESYLAVPDISDPNAFGFYAAGDSMEPDYPDGTLLIASPNTEVFDGDYCFIRFSEISKTQGCSFKRVYFMEDGRIRLVPINRQYVEQIFNRDEIIGLWPVVRCYGKLDRSKKQAVSRRKQQDGPAFAATKNRTSAAAG